MNETLFHKGSQVRDPSPQRADWRDQLESVFFCENAPAVQTAESQAALTPASALEKLKKGNARFVEKNMRSRDWQAKVPATADGQYLFAAILACMDSRNPIEIIFDQGIGDVFGIRIAGNIVNEDELGSMEYATKVVGVKLLVVLGHTSCGAVKGAIDDAKLGNLIRNSLGVNYKSVALSG